MAKTRWSHPAFFIPAVAVGRKSWLELEALSAVRTGETCIVDLPAAKDVGSFKLECRDCSAWALVNVQASKRDPQTFEMRCGRILNWAEREPVPPTPPGDNP